VCHVPILPLAESSLPEIEYTNNKEHRMVASGSSIVLDNEGSTGCRGSQAKGCNVHCNEYDTRSQSLEVCNDAAAADYMLGMHELSVPVPSIAKSNEGHKDGELIRDDDKNVYVNVHAMQNSQKLLPNY
jgi:hypothetical protein